MDDYGMEFSDDLTLGLFDERARRYEDTGIDPYKDAWLMRVNTMIQCGQFRRLDSPCKEKISMTTVGNMENHSNKSFDGTTDSLPLLDDYRLDDKNGGLSIDSMCQGEWNLSRGQGVAPYTGKGISSEKGKPGKCKVCGDDATGMYFGALVCVPCKTFFLRYAGDNFSFVCKGNKDCEISVTTRTQCKYCRYHKCLKAGMIRRVRPSQVQLSEGQQLCVVCHDLANGIHFGAITCEGCKKFFRRGLTEHATYTCKNSKNCVINPRTRNSCRYCRFQTCLSVGMSREAIQMGRPSKLAMESFGLQRGVRTANSHSGTAQIDHNRGSRVVATAKGGSKDNMEMDFIMGNNNPPKEEPSLWDWRMDQASIAHQYNADISQFSGQIADFQEHSTKHIMMDSYGSPHIGSGELFARTCNSTGDRTSNSSCLSLMSSSSPEIMPYNGGSWGEVSADSGSKPVTVQSVPLDNLYHRSNSVGSIHQLPSTAPSSYHMHVNNGQEILANEILSKIHHEKNDIPQSSLDSNMLQFSLNSIGLQNSSKMEHFDHETAQILQDNMVGEMIDSILDPCRIPEQNMEFGQQERLNLKYGTIVPFGNPSNQQQMHVQKQGPYKNLLADSTMFSFNSRQPCMDKKELTDLTHFGVSGDCGPRYITVRSPHDQKQEQSSCFVSSEVLTSSSSTGILSIPEQHSLPRPEDRGEAAITSLSSNNLTSKYQAASSSLTNSSSEALTMSIMNAASALICQISTNLDNEIANDDQQEDEDCPNNELTSIMKGCFIDGTTFEQQIETSTHYWRSQWLPDESITVDAKYWEIFHNIHPLYDKFVKCGSALNHALRIEFEEWVKMNGDVNIKQISDWVKDKVVPKYTEISMAYFLKIPGFVKFDTEDQKTLIHLAQSQSRILAAALAWYDPDTENFTDFLPWREMKTGQVDMFKQQLIAYAKKINARHMDPVEAAFLNIVVVVATDYPGLVKPEIIETYRKKFLTTFRAYTTAKYGSPNKRLEVIFKLIPQLRRLGLIHFAMTLMPTLGVTISESKEI